MKSSRRFGVRGARSKRCAIVTLLALAFSPTTGFQFTPVLHAQAQVAPVGNGFVLDAGDLRFIYEQILVAQDHAAGGTLLGPGPNQVHDPQLPRGLRTVDGSYNNLVPVPDQHKFGAADRLFPRLTTPVYREAEAADPTDPASPKTSYAQKLLNNVVYDSQPRIISNLIVDQSLANPAAVAAARNPCGSGGFVCSPPELDQNGNPIPDPASGALFIPNITPDFGLSAPFNVMFTFFGQFFDHGLDLVNKGGGAVIMPLQPDDPIINGPDGIPNTPDDIPPAQRFMVMTRGENQPGPDGIPGTADDIQEGVNQTTPWVDQNQTYTSHPSHQVFLREYDLVGGKPVQTGKVLDNLDFCAPRATGLSGDNICDIGTWADVKRQAATKLGIRLADQDVLNVPLVMTDPYGHFKPGLNGFPQLVLPGNVLLEGNPTANGGAGIDIPVDALRTGHAFLNDLAHNAVPSPGLINDNDPNICDFRSPPTVCTQAAGTYSGALLDRHFITGDGRGNENIGLTTVHQIFHSEHNRLRYYIDNLIGTMPVCAGGPLTPQLTSNCLTDAEKKAWGRDQLDKGLDVASGWDYGERLFQAARFGTEMQYQHLVFEEFARTIQPLINPFLGGLTNIDPAISAEFAHTVYRLGHSMLPERLDRVNFDGSDHPIRLFDGFLNPVEFNVEADRDPTGKIIPTQTQTLLAPAAAGAIIRGLTRQVGNELDEFVTSSVRNTLVGLPQDLPAINIARGRSEGIPPLNEVRRQFYSQSHDPTLAPYANWFEFGLGLRHAESLVNFIAAYYPSFVNDPTLTVADRRAQALTLADLNNPANVLFDPPDASGLNSVDFWIGGLAEKPSVFGGLLGSTFNVVFEKQLEHLQDGDRFYYLQRTDGLNLKSQLEGNSFSELIRRNTDLGATMGVIFKFADHSFDDTTAAQSFSDGSSVIVLHRAGLPDTKLFFDPLHAGKNIVVNGGPGDDHWIGDVGDDTMYGNDGNDRLEGGEGNDTLVGGAGDDILLGGNGDDVLKGGPGNDAMQSGPGFGGDIMIGGDGNDFMVGGDDGVEYFAGPGNDIIVDGAMRSEQMVGGPGDDWIDDGEGHDGGIFGDDGNLFDLLAGLSAIGGDDVLGGGPGQDNHFGEGGNDIFLMSEGSNKFFGDYGFDWITLRGWPAPEFIELSLLALPNVPVNFNDLRNKYRFVDGASGWDLNDHIAGSNSVLCVPPGEIAECLVIGMELTVEGASKFAGLQDLVENGFGKSLSDPAIPLIKGIGFMGGDILLGGKGNDTLEGKSGDDLIDGDLWLNVQLRATYNDPNFLCKDGVTRGVCLVDGPRELVDDVFSDPQRLNPGHIEIVRTIVDPYSDSAGAPNPRPAGDCASTNPVNCDTAVFNFPFAEYVITRNPNGTTTVQHVPPLPRAPGLAEGTDILRHMEQARFLEANGTFRFVSLSTPLNSIATGTVTISDTTPTEDQVLTATASVADANGFNPALVTLEWQVETAVPGVFTAAAIGNSFAPGNPEVGHALRVAARFTDNAGFAESVLSTPTAPVANINNPPTGAPTLSTTAPQVAEALSVSPAGIVDLDGLVGVSFTFQWQQGAVGGGTPFSPIAGATAASFTPTPTQVNRPLRVRVFYTDNHGTAEAILSAATDVVGNVIVGTTGPDTLTGTDGRDNVQGLAGADTITTGLGDDVITGGPGDDTINAGGGNDTITGGNGDDTINAGPGDDVILVGLNDGFDDVGGGAGNDVIRATANNVVIGLRALAGVETITANGFTGVTIATPNTATTLDFTGMTLTGIVSINGGNGNDTITGSSGPDTIIGGGGDDTMDGGGGNNVFKFALQSGADRILNFKSNPGPAGGQDKLDISARGITAANFATRVTIVATGAGNANTQIRFTGTTDTITLVGVALATVTIADFTLAP